jgi:hypothetical protein
MAESAFAIATSEYQCPHCGAFRGAACTTPAHKATTRPHKKRMDRLTRQDWNRCTVPALRRTLLRQTH